jgi:hypothetical protein
VVRNLELMVQKRTAYKILGRRARGKEITRKTGTFIGG